MKATLLCNLFGHKTVRWCLTGKFTRSWSYFERKYVDSETIYPVRSAFCLRCGQIVHKDMCNGMETPTK